MSDERDERGKRDDRDKRGERREERRALRLAAISMRCRPNFGLTQVQPELGHYLACIAAPVSPLRLY